MCIRDSLNAPKADPKNLSKNERPISFIPFEIIFPISLNIMKAQIKIMIELKISLVNSLRLFKGNTEDKFSLKKYARKIEPTHSTTENISFIKPLKVPTTREKINIPANKKSIQFKEIFPSRISMIDSTSY